MSIDIQKQFLKFRFNAKRRLEFYTMLSRFLEEGYPVNDLLEVIESELSDRSPRDYKRPIIKSLLRSLGNGEKLGTGLSDWAPTSELSLIRAGEDAGDIANAMKKTVKMSNAIMDIKSTVKSTLMQPVILMTVCFAVMCFISVNILPKLIAVSDPAKWTLSAQRLNNVSSWLVGNWSSVIFWAVLAWMAISYTFPRVTGTPRKYLDMIPPWSTYKSINSSIFLVSLASMLQTGIAVVDAIQLFSKISNPYVKSKIQIILRKTDAGDDIGRSLSTDFFDSDTSFKISIYAKLASVKDTMESIGEDSIQATKDRIVAVAKIVNYAAMLGTVGYIFWVMASIQDVLNTVT